MGLDDSSPAIYNSIENKWRSEKINDGKTLKLYILSAY